MDEIKKDDQVNRDFIAGVWQKVRYLEYLKCEDETIKHNTKILIIKNIKIGVCLTAIALMIIIPVLLTIEINAASIVIIGIVALSSGTLYEYIENVNIHGRIKHEN